MYPCIFRGQQTGTYNCGCGLGDKPVFECNNPVLEKDRCVLQLGNAKHRPQSKHLMSCSSCDFAEKPVKPDPPPRVRPAPSPQPPPLGRPPRPGDKYRAEAKALLEAKAASRRINQERGLSLGAFRSWDETIIAPDLPGKRFNSSILDFEDGYLLAFRDGWSGSQIHLIRLTKDFHPTGRAWLLRLFHKEANYGREDPRLFWHKGRVHVCYVGVVGGHSIAHTSVLYARLSEDAQRVEKIFYPELEGRADWEKNHSYFSHGEELYAVYSISPHRIIRVDGNKASFAYEAPGLPWRGGIPRGGASPVKVGESWWSFFHDRVSFKGVRTYRTGLYTFSAKPPFEPLRVIEQPLMMADHSTKPPDQYCAAIFCVGSVRAGDDWILSSGVHDRWTELHKFSHADLEQRLRPILRSRKGSNDHRIFRAIQQHDEYRLGDLRFGPEDVVIDIGAHAGGFCTEAWRRGSRSIRAYEANPGNFAALQSHTANLSGLEIHYRAVWERSGETVYSHPPTGHAENLGASWVNRDPVDSPVSTVAFDDILREASQVAFLKIDCERAEFEFVPQSNELHRVKRIAMEFHATEDLPISLLSDKLLAEGFQVEVVPAGDNPLMGMIFAFK